jgi:succinate dehydrogenase hydrophobic anchor subunit
MLKKLNPFLMPIFRCALFVIAGLLFSTLTNKSLEQASQWWSVICVICNIITIIVLIIVFKHEGTSYRKVINLASEKMSLKETIFVIVIMLLLGMGGMYGFGYLIYGYVPVTMVQPIPVGIAIINIILLPITIIFAELPLYLGYSLNRIEQITNNKVLAIVYSTFFYALQHSFMPLIFDFRHILFRFLAFLPLMIVLGLMYYRSKKLTKFMIGHAILDLATAIQILITSISPAIFEIMKSMTK